MHRKLLNQLSSYYQICLYDYVKFLFQNEVISTQKSFLQLNFNTFFFWLHQTQNYLNTTMTT